MVRDQDPAPACPISLRGQASLPEREECENISAAEAKPEFVEPPRRRWLLTLPAVPGE